MLAAQPAGQVLDSRGECRSLALVGGERLVGHLGEDCHPYTLRAYPSWLAHLDTADGLRGALSSASTWAHHAFGLASAPRSTLDRPSRAPQSG